MIKVFQTEESIFQIVKISTFAGYHVKVIYYDTQNELVSRDPDFTDEYTRSLDEEDYLNLKRFIHSALSTNSFFDEDEVLSLEAMNENNLPMLEYNEKITRARLGIIIHRGSMSNEEVMEKIRQHPVAGLKPKQLYPFGYF